MLSIIFMTPYILLLFHLLNSGNFQTILQDRVIDTMIGSGIAFLANFLLLPAWEHEQVKNYMAETIISNKTYFADISAAFIGKPVSITQYKLSRKNAFVALANLSDAFSRMLSEPKNKQKNGKKEDSLTSMPRYLWARPMHWKGQDLCWFPVTQNL